MKEDELLSWILPARHPKLPSVEEVAEWLPPVGGKVRRILLLSDIHANWHALVAVLRHARKQEYDTTWFLGDIVGYGPRPIECVQFFRQALSRKGRWVVGNHDLHVAACRDEDKDVKDFLGIGPITETTDEPRRPVLENLLDNVQGVSKKGYGGREGRELTVVRHWHEDDRKLSYLTIITDELHRQSLESFPADPDLWEWFRQAISSKRVGPVIREYGNFRQVFVHADPRPNNQTGPYLNPYDEFLLRNCLSYLYTRLRRWEKIPTWLLVGHTHMVCLVHQRSPEDRIELLPIPYGEPISIAAEGVYSINPGSVGLPRDGDPRPSYAILDVEEGTVTFFRVDYDIIDVQMELRDDTYPKELEEQLGTGSFLKTYRFERVYRRMENDSGVMPCAWMRGSETAT